MTLINCFILSLFFLFLFKARIFSTAYGTCKLLTFAVWYDLYEIFVSTRVPNFLDEEWILIGKNEKLVFAVRHSIKKL